MKFKNPLQPSKEDKFIIGEKAEQFYKDVIEPSKEECGHQWTEDSLYCVNCGKSRTTFTTSEPSKEECVCGCHTSESSSEDMKKNGCDYCSFNHDEPSKEEMLSNCCKTPLKTFNSADYDKEETPNGSTCYFVCSKCDKPCDMYSEPSKESPEDKIREIWEEMKEAKRMKEKGIDTYDNPRYMELENKYENVEILFGHESTLSKAIIYYLQNL